MHHQLNLPQSFPTLIPAHLQEGSRNGLPQWTAHYLHEGKAFKLIVSEQGGRSPVCKRNETWLLRPSRSPNGHIVFCSLDRQLLTAYGEHPAACHTKPDQLIVIRSFVGSTKWHATATLVSLASDGKQLVIRYKAPRWRERSGEQHSGIPEAELVVPAMHVHLGEDDYCFPVLDCVELRANEPIAPHASRIQIKLIDAVRSREREMPENILFG